MEIKDNLTEITELYTKGLHSLQMIADKFNCTRQYIKRLLNESGVSTKKGAFTQAEVECLKCGKKFFKKRAQIRNQVGNHFCSKLCWHEFLRFDDAKDDKTARSRARLKMAHEILRLLKLPPGSIVHHIDRNQQNNNAWNLMLLIDQATHLRIHRNCPYAPESVLFDGTQDSPAYRKACQQRLMKQFNLM